MAWLVKYERPETMTPYSSLPENVTGPVIRTGEETSAVWNAVRELRTMPLLGNCTADPQPSPQPEYCVQLEGKWYSLDLVRRILLAREDELTKLHTDGVPLDWLEYPGHRTFRDDLPHDQSELDKTHSELLDKAFVLALSVVARLPASGDEWPSVDSAAGQELADNVLHTLGRTSQQIRSAMSRRLRRSGRAVLVLEKQTDSAIGRWYPIEILESAADIGPEGDPVDMYASLMSAALLLDGFEYEKADRFARIILVDVLEGELVLPGFRIIHGPDEQSIGLLWQASSIEHTSSMS